MSIDQNIQITTTDGSHNANHSEVIMQIS